MPERDAKNGYVVSFDSVVRTGEIRILPFAFDRPVTEVAMMKHTSGIYLVTGKSRLDEGNISATTALIAIVPGADDATGRVKLDSDAKNNWLRLVDKLVGNSRFP